jgi:hypothetical protein
MRAAHVTSADAEDTNRIVHGKMLQRMATLSSRNEENRRDLIQGIHS